MNKRSLISTLIPFNPSNHTIFVICVLIGLMFVATDLRTHYLEQQLVQETDIVKVEFSHLYGVAVFFVSLFILTSALALLDSLITDYRKGGFT